MLQPASAVVDYCACCQKCLANEPVAIRCEVCKNPICNDCRAIDSRKPRTIIATSLTKSGGGKQPSGRLLTMLGSKLSVLSAFRGGLSRGSFEFDELEEDEPLPSSGYRSNRKSRQDDEEFDRYFDKPDRPHSDRPQSDHQHSDRQHSDRHPDRLHSDWQHSDRQPADRQHPDRQPANRHNKIEKQLSFQYTSERRRRLSAKPGEGGSLDIDNSLKSGALLAVPIDQQKQSRSDSQLNRRSDMQQSTINKANSGSFERPATDQNNNSFARVRPAPAFNRMVSLDVAAATLRESPLHIPLERSNMVDYDETLQRSQRFHTNLKPNDFILSICMMCAKQM